MRRLFFFVYFTIAASMIFLQMGFVSIGDAGSVVYCVLPVVGPIVATAMLLGVRAGFMQGLLAGLLLCVHAALQPSTIVEYLCLTPLGAAGLALGGLTSAPLFALILDKSPEGTRRMALLVASCLATSAVTTALFVLGFATHSAEPLFFPPTESLGGSMRQTYELSMSPLTLLVGNTAIASVFALITDAVARTFQQVRSTQSVRLLFRLQLLGMVALTLLVGAASAHVWLSTYCWAQTNLDMKGEAAYLTERALGTIAEAGGVQEALPAFETMADMYDLATDGSMAICDGSEVLATNNPAYRTSIPLFLFEGPVSDSIRMTFYDQYGDGGVHVGYAYVAQQDSVRIVLIRSYARVYRDRLFAMLSIATTTVTLLALVYLYANRLLGKLLVDPIDQTNKSLTKITEGSLDEVVEARGSSEFSSLSDGINTTVSALKDYAEESARRIEEDLSTARRIQQSALPASRGSSPWAEALDIYAGMNPAKEVGGDFYDFFPLGNHKLGFLIADVSGKGIPAALFMMEAKNVIRSCMQSTGDLAAAINAANAILCEGNDEMMFVTAWMAMLDWKTGELTYINAGHNTPLLRRGGIWSPMPEDGDPIMGVSDALSYTSRQLRLAGDDELLLYTDGVTEAMDQDGDLYGDARLLAFLQRHAGLRPQALDEALRANLACWANDAEQSDDITMLTLRFRRGNEQDREL